MMQSDPKTVYMRFDPALMQLIASLLMAAASQHSIDVVQKSQEAFAKGDMETLRNLPPMINLLTQTGTGQLAGVVWNVLSQIYGINNNSLRHETGGDGFPEEAVTVFIDRVCSSAVSIAQQQAGVPMMQKGPTREPESYTDLTSGAH